MIFEKVDSRIINISTNFDWMNNPSDLIFFQVTRATHNKWLLFLKFLIKMLINMRLIVKIIINKIAMSRRIDYSGPNILID
jgi:hypothetical protein